MKKISFVLTLFSGIVLSYQQICNRPSNWQEKTVTERTNLAQNIAMVKILSIENRKIEAYGETYDVVVDLLCPVKVNRGVILQPSFTITQMGARDKQCPSRNVIEGADYILYLNYDRENDLFSPNEVNQQQCVWETTDENFKLFPDVLQHCYLPSGCSVRSDPWHPLSTKGRADLAEIIVKVRVTDIHYITNDPATLPTAKRFIYFAPPILCGYLPESLSRMRTREQLGVRGVASLPQYFNTTGFGSFQGDCSEKLVSKGHDFIMFLTRFYALPPLIGATVPPDLLDNYFLSPEEVNQQQAVFNVTTETVADLKDYLEDCPGAATKSEVHIMTYLSVVLLSLWLISS